MRCEEELAAAWGKSECFSLQKVRSQPGYVPVRPCSSHPDLVFPNSWSETEVSVSRCIYCFILYVVTTTSGASVVFVHFEWAQEKKMQSVWTFTTELICTYRNFCLTRFGLVLSTSLKIALAWRRKWTEKRGKGNLIWREFVSLLFVFMRKSIHSVTDDDVFAFASLLNNLAASHDTFIQDKQRKHFN